MRNRCRRDSLAHRNCVPGAGIFFEIGWRVSGPTCELVNQKRTQPVEFPSHRGRLCATTAPKGDRDVTVNWKQLCCMRDEGWSLGIGLQDQISNHRKLLGSNDSGGERFGKGGREPVRCVPRRRTKVNR